MFSRAVLAIVVGYLLGSLDFAVLVAGAKGVDIYQVGSGNPGTANVLRTLGRRAGAMVMVGDIAKGFAGALIGETLGGGEWVGYLAGAAAVIGHCFPVWHRFKGGKGVATAAGMVLWLDPLVVLAMTVLWVIVVRLTKISSIASLLGAVLAVPMLALLGRPWWAMVTVAGVAVLVVLRHRGNIERLMRGEERQVRRERGQPSPHHREG